MKMSEPLVVEDALLIASNLAEDGNGAWSSIIDYSRNDVVYVASTHSVYKSTANGNLNHDPTTSGSEWWVRISYTNAWRALKLDEANATIAESTDGIEYTIESDGTYGEIAFLGLKSAEVTVVVKNASAVEVYNETAVATLEVSGTTWFRPNIIFTGLPVEDGFTVEIAIADTGVSGNLASVAKICLVRTFDLGDTTIDDSSLSYKDLSLREQDQWGKWLIVERGVSTMVSLRFAHAISRGRWVRAALKWKRLSPCLYWLDSGDYGTGYDVMDIGLFAFGYADTPRTLVGVNEAPSITFVDILGLAFPQPLAVSYTAVSPSPPASFGAGDWSLASGGTSSLNVTITSVDAIATDIEYQYRITGSGDPWSTAASTGGVGGFSISALDDDTEYDVRIRPTNDAGDGDWSATKTATTDAYFYARVLAERDFSVDNMLSSEYITFAVDSAYTEIQIISQGIGDGTATSPQMTIEVSDDGGATWETGAYEDGYIRGGSYVQLGGSGNPQTRMFSSTIFGSGGGVTRIFNLDSGVKPHTNTFTRDSTNMFARISTLDNSAITHWRLTANADVTGGFIKILGVLA